MPSRYNADGIYGSPFIQFFFSISSFIESS